METRIKELRARWDLTQEELAQRAGVRRETIVHLERGRYNPSLKLAVKLARLLEIPVEELFIFSEQELERDEL